MKKFLYMATILSVLALGCAKDFEIIKVHVTDESNSLDEALLRQTFAERVTIEDSAPDRNLAAGFACYQRKLFGSSRVLTEGHLLDKPSDWRAHYILGLLELADENFAGAARCFQTALRFSPTEAGQRAVIYLGLGQSLEHQGQSALSRQHYLTALNLDTTMVAAQNGIDRLTSLSSVSP